MSHDIEFVARPFEGLEREAELVAMRGLIPLATLPATLTSEYGGENILIVTLLPDMLSAMRREDGVLLVAMQTLTSTGDASRDVAARIIDGLELKAGDTYSQNDLPEPGPRLGDVVASFGDMELLSEPSFWLTDEEAAKPESKEMLEQAATQVIPTVEVEGCPKAYWCRMSREFVRWVRPEEPDQILDALARLRAARELEFEGAKKFAGFFRSYGMVIPVWELERGSEASDIQEALVAFGSKFEAALASTEPLTFDEKRARQGIASRQVSLR